MLLCSLRSPMLPLRLRHCRLLCACASNNSDVALDMPRYHEAFGRRMAMAGIKPHHRIALGVSGGADSMALCVLAVGWKQQQQHPPGRRPGDGSSFIDGILAVIVDHRLRSESAEEAEWVGERVSRMGIKCKIVPCDWSAGRPKQGHLEVAARDARYKIFQDICIHHQIGVLLTAHHADDQAELFILRLSRNSGVLGLAGMAFVTQLFSNHLLYNTSGSNHSVLLVRPMLEFSKNDMYKICQKKCQDWVEDPSNQSSLFARNRIRKSLKNFSNQFKSELHAFISTCRLTRRFIEHSCCKMMETSVIIMIHGYAVIDLEKLNPHEIEDLRLSKFLSFILQFVSQRHRQIRGGVLQLLLDYIRDIPCKNALTAAGCYLCPSPGSKGKQVLVCCSPDLPQSLNTISYQAYSNKGDDGHLKEVIMNAKLSTDVLTSSLNVPFLNVKSPSSILEEAKKLNIISDETYNGIQSLRMVENEHFSVKTNAKLDDLTHCTQSLAKLDGTIACGQLCLFMNRFHVRWEFCGGNAENEFPRTNADDERHVCQSCNVSTEMKLSVRCMVEADWLHLATLSKIHMQGGFKEIFTSVVEASSYGNNIRTCSDFMHLSAKRALQKLNSIPAAARRALPVLVDSQGTLLSIPAIEFQRCTYMRADSFFRPQVPLGGGFSSYI